MAYVVLKAATMNGYLFFTTPHPPEMKEGNAYHISYLKYEVRAGDSHKK